MRLRGQVTLRAPAFETLGVQTRAAVKKLADEVAHAAAEWCKWQMEVTAINPDTGRSLPGGFPAVQTGNLQESVTGEAVQAGSRTTLVVRARMPYARFLEYGTARMAARPFMRPTREKWSAILRTQLESMVPRMIRSARARAAVVKR